MYDILTKAKSIVDYKHFTRNLRLVAKRYGVSKSTVQRWVKEEGIVVRKRRSKKAIHSAIKQCMRQTIKNNPFITMQELAKCIQRECGTKLSGRTVCRYATADGLSCKKAVSVIDHQHDNRLVLNFCQQFSEAYASKNLFCIDESCFSCWRPSPQGQGAQGRAIGHCSKQDIAQIKIYIDNGNRCRWHSGY